MPVVPRLLSWLAILCTLAVGQSAVARSACPNGTLSIGTDATFPPFSSKVGEKFVGLEIELGDAIAERLGCDAQWVNSSFDAIFPALLAGKYDMVIASVTITPERRESMLFSEPYVNAGQTIAVRKGSPPLSELKALRGKRVGVGLNTTGQYLLEGFTGIETVKYPSVDLALSDLRNRRLDAAVGDLPVFRYMIRESFPDLRLTGQPLNKEVWGMAFAPSREELVRQVNGALEHLRADGIVAALEAKHLGTLGVAGGTGEGSGTNAPSGAASSPIPATGATPAVPGETPLADNASSQRPMEGPRFRTDRFLASIPLFLQGARWTLILSLFSFVAAVPLGLLIAIGRMSRLWLLRAPTTAYVEVLRGTPLLVQIFFIYFVLPAFGLSLPDYITAVLALSINASAYISEIFRAGLESLEAGQGEAAEALGLTRGQALRHVLVPQAVRRVVPPLTNECIALIKESSLVSIMGMTELTRTGQELSSRFADPLTIWPGVALTYFLMTFPLTRLSMHLERRLHAGQRQTQER